MFPKLSFKKYLQTMAKSIPAIYADVHIKKAFHFK